MFNQFEWSKFNKNALVGLTNLEKVCLFQANPTFVENWKFNHNLYCYFSQNLNIIYILISQIAKLLKF